MEIVTGDGSGVDTGDDVVWDLTDPVNLIPNCGCSAASPGGAAPSGVLVMILGIAGLARRRR